MYEATDKLKSQYHMSTRQAEATIVIVGNKLFHDETEIIDVDTLPAQKDTREVGKSLEVLALCEIVKEIMNSHANTVVTYSDDGSKSKVLALFQCKDSRSMVCIEHYQLFKLPAKAKIFSSITSINSRHS